jgi:hypothetical protein
MAGPSVAVRVTADTTAAGKAMGDVASTGASAASKLHSAFGSALAALNTSGVLGPFGEALGGINEAIGAVAEHAHEIGPAMLGVGTALAGVGLGLQALGSKDQAAHQQLQASVQATGKDYDDYAKQVDEAIKHQEKFGDSSSQTQDALSKLTQATHDPQVALNLLGEATDLAAAKHESLGTASVALGKVYDGNTKLLKQYGIVLDAHTKLTADGKTGTQALADVLKGQATAAADTFSGKLSAMKTHFEDMAATIGQKYGPALTGVGSVMAGVGAAIEVVQALNLSSVAAWLADAAAAAAAAVAENLALLGIPILIAAVVAGIAWMVTHWGQVKDAVMDAYNWIKDNWPLLLAILTGPFGVAALEIYKHFDDIKAVVGDAVGYITTVWSGLVGFLASVVGAIAYYVSVPWHAASDAAAAVAGAIINAWNGVAGFFAWITGIIAYYLSLPWHVASDQAGAVANAVVAAWNGVLNFFHGFYNDVAGIFSSVGSAIYNGIAAGINGIRGLWNSTLGAVHFSIPSWVPGLGGDSFGFPSMATGGIVTSPTVALIGEAGPEAVIPLGKGLNTGPAVVIQQANFSTELDVESFLRRAAWAVQTQRI